MVHVLVWVITVGLLVQLAVLVWNIAYWKLRRQPSRAATVSLSVLIPARNERHNIPRLLASLAAQSLAPTEIVVCDDGSEDGTDVWLAANAAAYGAEWFRAGAKPEGWAGKNWACHLLGQRAQGEWLVFLDADVEPGGDFIAFLAGILGDSQAVLVTAFPNMRPSSIGAGLLVGMVPFSVFTTLPLLFAERRPNPAFGFANGQIIAFRRADYQRLNPHEQVRGELLEDVALAKLVKRAGGEVYIADAGRTLSVKMYASTEEAIEGFSKNAVAICGSMRRAIVIAAIMAFLYLVPLVLAAADVIWAWLPIGLSAALFGVSVSLVGLPWWYAFLYPAAILSTEYVIVRSIVWHRRGQLRWKGRVYPAR